MTYAVAEFKSGDLVFKQGDEGKIMYVVQEGQVEVLQEVGEIDWQVAVLERGDFFGEMAVLEGEARSHSVRVMDGGAKLVSITPGGFKSMLERNPALSVRMIRKLGKRLQKSEDMLLRAEAGRTAEREDAAGAAVTPGNARLFVVKLGRELTVPEQGEISIGRLDPVNSVHPDIDLTQIDIELTTSRRHARLLRRNQGFFIQEVQATNGTFVNGQRISAESPIEIRNGDDIMLGAVHMRFLVD